MKKIYKLQVWEETKDRREELIHTTYSTNFKDIQKRIFKKNKPEKEEKTIYEIKIQWIKKK